jgi:hypothetical protein
MASIAAVDIEPKYDRGGVPYFRIGPTVARMHAGTNARRCCVAIVQVDNADAPAERPARAGFLRLTMDATGIGPVRTTIVDEV